MNLKEFVKGFRFLVAGQIYDTISFTNQNGETVRMVRLASCGKKFSLTVDTDADLAKYDAVKGKWAKAVGSLIRRSGSTGANGRIEQIQVEGDPGWKDLTEADLMQGCTFGGVGIVAQKRSGVYNGTAFRKCQINVWGETFEIRDIDPETFEGLPERGPIQIQGHLDTVLASTNSRKDADMVLVIDHFSIPAAAAERKPEPAAKAG